MLGNLQIRGGELCVEKIPSECGIVIFGASGDLSFRKLIPSLFSLYEKQLLPEKFFIIGAARSDFDDGTFRKKISGKFKTGEDKRLSSFLEHCYYEKIEYGEINSYAPLMGKIESLNKGYGTGNRMIFYLATPPSLYGEIPKHLLSMKDNPVISLGGDWPRFIFEKPYCLDLESAISLDLELHKTLSENQIYRIDHYLGKDTVQNILMFRFANAIFEPVWSNKYIDHVQITVAESIGIEHRAGYFEQSGLLRDMFQNHIIDMIAMVAMEPPSSFEADRIRDERVKIIRAIRKFSKQDLKAFVCRGQYKAGMQNGKPVPAYCEESGVDPKSNVETFVAMKLFVDNWRWNGVPFYIRAGKRLKQKISQIAVVFKPLPHSIFPELSPQDLVSNVVVFSIQPDEGVAVTIQAKQPGPKLCMSPLLMDFKYSEVFGMVPPEAYERLLLDCMLGDQTLFIRSDGMELAWSVLKPFIDTWYKEGIMDLPPLEFYDPDSFGPDSSIELIRKDGREWLIS